MRTLLSASLVVLFASVSAIAQTAPQAAPAKAAPLPAIRKTGGVAQMMVDGKPFIMLSGELHNSSASSVKYMKPLWKRLEALHLNTVIGTSSWELVEPEEGKFDFAMVDYQIKEARQRGLKLVLIWFATFKNANSSYVPLWVKKNTQRFPRIQRKNGAGVEELTPVADASAAADAKAFGALMRHIRQVDPQHTVIMMQVENESGMTGDSRDRSPLAESVWNKPVPAALMNYLQENKSRLLPEITKVWGANGFKTSGTWPEVFGSDAFGDEVFMAWHVAGYINRVAAAGKAELDIPMYANAWLVQSEGQLPGGYPSGGPVSRVADIWRAAAPKLDMLSPDIYLDDFKGITASYTRSGNPLFIPEARADVGNLVWAIGEHAALGYSPFGIENLNEDNPLGRAYEVLGGMIPVLTKYQAEGKVKAVLQGTETSQTVSFGGYQFNINFGGGRGGAVPQPAPQPAAGQQAAPGTRPQPPARGYGLIVNTGPDEFLVAGSGLRITFKAETPGPQITAIGIIDEGRYSKGQWIPLRRINGDESSSGNNLSLSGGPMAIRKVKLYRHD